MGIPVVATSVGGMRYSVKDGETGILVPPQNPIVLAEKLEWLLKEPDRASYLGHNGRQYFLERFTMDRMVADTANLYTGLVHSN